MAYTTAARIKYIHPSATAFVDSNVTAVTTMILTLSAELNTFLKVDSDICAYTEGTREAYIVEKALCDVLARWVNYEEMAGNIAPQNRVEMIPSHLYQNEFVHIHASLRKDRMEEHPKCYSYSLVDGRLRKWR
jgi:hypothetical protein